MPKPKEPTAEPKPVALGVLTSLVGFNLRVAQLVVYEDFMRNAPVRGLTPGQLAILIVIHENPDMTQQHMSRTLRVEKSTLVIRLHRLADRGLIERVRSTTDRRQNGLRLTRQGATSLRAMLRFVAEHERKISARLTAAERKQLIALLHKIGR